MEILSADNKSNEYVDLNNELLEKYKIYVMYSYDIHVRNEKKFIGSINSDDQTILHIEYIIYGSFSQDKNIWIWSDLSKSLNNSAKIEISHLRSYLIDKLSKTDNSDLKKFCSTDFMVLSSLELSNYMYQLSTMISNIYKKCNIITIQRDNIINFIIAKKLLYNGIE